MTTNAILELEKRGYVFSLTEKGLEYKSTQKNADRGLDAALLLRVAQNRDRAVEFLRRRQERPAANIPLAELHDYLVDHGLRLAGISGVNGCTVTFVVEDAQ